MRHEFAMWIGVNIGIAVILVLKGVGLAQSPAPVVNPRIALVNGDAITLAEVDAVLKARPAALQSQSAMQLRQQRTDMLSAMTDDLLLRQFFRTQSAKIEPSDIKRMSTSLETSLKAQNKTMADYCREVGQTPEQIQANMVMLLQLDQYVKSRTSNDEMKKYFEANKDYFDKTTVRTSHIVIRTGAGRLTG